MSRPVVCSLCALLASVVLIHSTRAEAQQPPTSTASAVGARTTSPTGGSPGAPPDLSGTWAQVQVTASITEIPVLKDVKSKTRSLLLWEIAQQGRDLTVRETVCKIDITSTSSAISTSIPSAFVRAVSGTVRNAKLEPRADGSWRFFQKKRYVVRGVKLRKPTRDRLPDDEDDRRIFDADGDGKPGLTVKIRGLIDGEVYVVQRAWSELDGEPIGKSQLNGWLKWGSEQSVVDATSVFLKGNPKSRPLRRRSAHYFKSRRVPKGMTCAQLVQKQRALF